MNMRLQVQTKTTPKSSFIPLGSSAIAALVGWVKPQEIFIMYQEKNSAKPNILIKYQHRQAPIS